MLYNTYCWDFRHNVTVYTNPLMDDFGDYCYIGGDPGTIILEIDYHVSQRDWGEEGGNFKNCIYI